MIEFIPWPSFGQFILSPTSATFLLLTIIVDDAEITAPPCVVLSPSKTKPLDILKPRCKNGHQK
ncbi:hypothetical protein D3C81_2047980 [compost metagenome]